MSTVSDLLRLLYKDFGRPLVNRVMDTLGDQADEATIRKAVQREAKANAPKHRQRESIHPKNKKFMSALAQSRAKKKSAVRLFKQARYQQAPKLLKEIGLRLSPQSIVKCRPKKALRLFSRPVSAEST